MGHIWEHLEFVGSIRCSCWII